MNINYETNAGIIYNEEFKSFLNKHYRKKVVEQTSHLIPFKLNPHQNT